MIPHHNKPEILTYHKGCPVKNLLATVVCSLLPLISHANSPEYVQGYLSAKLEDKFCTDKITTQVIGENVVMFHCPDDVDSETVKAFIEDCCPNFSVANAGYMEIVEMPAQEYVFETGSTENLLPELNPFFPTMLAQPHMLGYSVGARSSDRIFKSSIPISIGDQFSLFQFKSFHYGHLYFGIEACVWAIFDARPKSLSLINADYFVALPFTYINDRFSARLRLFHESSHLGDEFLLENQQIQRMNPSMEVIDLSLCYEPIDPLQLFFGYSRVIRSDDHFQVQPNSVYYGMNYFFDFASIRIFNLVAFPYFALYFNNDENKGWGLESSATLGYQWEKAYGRKLRLYVMGHNGYSAEGQFATRKSRYVSVNLMYGY